VNRYINPKYDKEYKKGMIANTKIVELNTRLLSDLKKEPKDFLQLLQVLDNIEGDYWLTFMSSHPNYMTTQLVDFIASSKHIRPYLHFALQSGSDRILKKMNRRYEAKEFKKIAKYMKAQILGLGLSTDVIVGFPGESEEDLMQTAALMQELEFDMAFLSEFSSRKGTAAALLPDDVPHKEKERRKKYLNDEVLALSALKNNEKMKGKIFKCLIEKKLSANKYLARTGNYKEISFSSNKEYRVGEFVDLKVIAYTPWALQGNITS
jgi:tRNA-2-methylthio-N6-dimethylallyladenosine synthase